MKPTIRVIVAALVTAFPAFAWDVPASGPPTAQVRDLETWANGAIHFTLVGSPALCTTGQPQQSWGVIDPGTAGLSTDGAKNMLGILVASKLTGRPVTVYGWNAASGVCNVGAVIWPP